MDLPPEGILAVSDVPTGTIDINIPPIELSDEYEGAIDVDILTDEAELNIPFDVQISSLPNTIVGENVLPVSGTNNYLSTRWYQGFRDLHKEWGTRMNDTHFLNMAADTQSGSKPWAHASASGDFNVNHIERRYVFHTIGDVEIYSGSRGSGSYNITDFTDHRRFFNRQNITEFVHENTTYESYINGNPGPQKGRAMGKTRYFYTASDGTVTLPSNHVSKFDNPWTNTMYKGAQNTNPGLLPIQREDYSTASFYRAKVTGGENQLIIRTKKPTLGPNNKIMY